MKFRDLRRVLQAIVVAGLPSAGCVNDLLDDDCTKTVDKTITVSQPAEPPLQLRIESCRVDVDACYQLCQLAMQRANLQSAAESCKVTFQDDEVDIKVSYTIYNSTGNCSGVEGRRPAGLRTPDHLNAHDRAGAWLAHAAWLEAASIHAFVHLAHELGLHGAPKSLVRAALVAARDEVEHTTMMTRLAARYGARPHLPEVAAPQPRSLEALAIENAVEGCVRETWGAVVALWQSRTARDPEVRAAFTVIARDEARHAALAWAVDRWVSPMLDAAALARLALAREAAARELFDGHEAIAALGLPDALQARGLVARTYDSLWTGGRS